MREPIVLPLQHYTGPMNIDALMVWFDQLLVDQRRVLATNLQAAIDAGELDADTDLKDVLDEATLAADDDRAEFRRALTAVLAQAAGPVVH